jgi:hypothetical protein
MPWRAYTVFGDVLARPSVPPSYTTVCPSSTLAFFPASSLTTQRSGLENVEHAVVERLHAPPIVASAEVAAHDTVLGSGRSTTVALHDVVELQAGTGLVVTVS